MGEPAWRGGVPGGDLPAVGDVGPHHHQVREHSSAVERCGPHVAIFPVMLRSSDRGDVGAHYHQLLAHALHLPEPLRHTLAGVAPNIQTYVLHSDEELIDSSYDGE